MDSLLQFLDRKAGGTGPRYEFANELGELPLPLHLVVFHFLLTDEGAGPLLGFQHTPDFQFPVRSHYRIGIDGKVYRHLPDRGKLMPRGQSSGGDPAQHLVDDLPVHGNAASHIQPEYEDPVSLRIAHLK